MKNQTEIPRRQFLTTSALSVMSYRSLQAAEANDKLNIAVVGIGGMGGHNTSECKGQNIVAICDVDGSDRAGKKIKLYPGASVYTDFRVMFDKEQSIDAVIVATPDHSHAVIAMAARRRLQLGADHLRPCELRPHGRDGR
jgi:D-arabinose 1-dehydrogenase-like Zn-dependent alcohol dehydrogenase